MSAHNRWLAGDNLVESFAKTAIGLISLGMGVGQLISCERGDMTEKGKITAKFCDAIWADYVRFQQTMDGRGDATIYEARSYDFQFEISRQEVDVEAVDFGDVNLDGKGMWTRVIAVRFNTGVGWSEPDFLVRSVTV